MKKIFPVIAMLLMVGCSFYHVDSKTETTKYFPPKKKVTDVIYVERSDRPFEVIGQVIVSTERRQTLESVMPKFQYEAAQIGGDAFTDIRTDAGGTWKKIKPQALLGNAYIRANYSAKVIVFTTGQNPTAVEETTQTLPTAEPVEAEVVTEEIPAPAAE
jgi:hypothetical protein